ncbi:SDR family oxidoreductase [Saccharothrix australiensis]|uniref:Uncharacterized protein YbjT (DUF2867 family) n=1 Tax=Saccharothrix australiensis TaxID=2072 RepID=A0A495W7A6_9PSEU|nr:NAD(P)H-binding protein [Saccharothrix australiensis]RKT57566.1 uncharacterized protein YbjT (DUF2867 family) [Saccharothrix australiensis]
MTILVTGATGNVGRHVVEQLVARDVPVRALTRNPDKAGLPRGAETVKADLTEPAGVPLDGVTAIFLLAVLESGDAAGLAAALLKRARDLRRVVFLSSDAVAVQRPGSCELHQSVEEVVEAAGVEWTHLRPGEFMSNKMIWAESIKKENVVRAAYPDAVGTPIHEADIAEVAVRALLEDGHAGRAYRLSGPEALTTRQQVAAFGEGLGREIAFEALTYGQARAALIREVGLPPDIAEYLMGYQAQFNEEPSELLPTFEEVTGRRGRTLAQWAAEHADAFSVVR